MFRPGASPAQASFQPLTFSREALMRGRFANDGKTVVYSTWDGERYLRLFEKLRTAMPDVAIRTTFIVGFPGETNKHFEYLLSFMREARLDRVGAFMYSPEPGTPSQGFAMQVPMREKRRAWAAPLTANRS